MTANHPHSEFAELDPNDQRCALRKVTPRDGLTLRQAMLFYGDERDADDFRRLEPSVGKELYMSSDKNALARFAMEMAGSNLRSIYQRLVSSLVNKLVAGELHATGFAVDCGIAEPAQIIPAERWRTLHATIETSQAYSAGVMISGILVFRRPRKAGAVSKKTVVSWANVRTWYKSRLRAAAAAALKYTREDDEAAARLHFGCAPRQWLRELRRDLAPAEWGEVGRPKSKRSPL